MIDPLLVGRSVVVAPGDPIPAAWSSCERVRVERVDSETADLVVAAWRERRCLVVELLPGIGLDDPTTPPPEAITDRQPWEWSVDLDLVAERLHHGLWANSVDARGGRAPSWRWGEMAVRMGAVLSPEGSDIALADGSPALCDAGPLDVSLAGKVGMAVVHRVALEHGSLEPFGATAAVGVLLAPDQLAAVEEPGGAVRVIAPAGSGKTRVLAERARLLLRGWRLPPGAMTLVAYNVRAAAEMNDRLGDLAGVRVRTLNSLGLRLCGSRSTIEEVEVRRTLAALVSFPRRAESDPAAPWIEALGRVRLGLVRPERVEQELPDVSDLDRIARSYRSQLRERGVVDFDEQMTGAIERLLADPAFRLRSQRYARILLVDELQDLTPAHMLLLRLLSGPAGSVFAVGDDDQTIYGYAGATPRWLVDFDRWFPGAAMHSLRVNYRCPPEVVAAASNLLTRNALRVAKEIRAATPSSGAMERPGLSVLPVGAGPAGRSAATVRQLIDGGVSGAEVAVLARVNASLAPVQIILRNAGIQTSGGVDGRFLQRGGVRAALAWLNLAVAPGDALPGSVMIEAARRPKRGMSLALLDLVGKKRSIEELASLARWLEGKGSEREAGKVRDLVDDMELVRSGARNSTTAKILSIVRSRVGDGGLDASAKALDNWSHGAIAAHGDDLDALIELAELEEDPVRFPSWLSEQLAADDSSEGVLLASIHAVKGREWPHVVIHHASAGLMPHRLAEDSEEERRVFHVGLTRGRSSVTVVPGPRPSPFLSELDAPGAPPSNAPETHSALNRSRSAAPVAGVSHDQIAPSAEPLAVSVGLRFDYLGHTYQVIEVTADGVRSLIGPGPATTSLAFGKVVMAEGHQALLAHPRFADAWDALRTWRAERSKALGKPAFVVFDDKTLRMVAATLPVKESALLAISGIGAVKLESYGDELMSITERFRSS